MRSVSSPAGMSPAIMERAERLTADVCGILFGDRKYRPVPGTFDYSLYCDVMRRFAATEAKRPQVQEYDASVLAKLERRP